MIAFSGLTIWDLNPVSWQQYSIVFRKLGKFQGYQQAPVVSEQTERLTTGSNICEMRKFESVLNNTS